MEILILYRHLSTRLLVRFGITSAFHALPKAWFWDEKSLGSIKNSNRLFRKSVRTRRNRRRLSDSDFYCFFDANGCGKPWKHGFFGVLASAVIFRQIPPSSVLATWLEIVSVAFRGDLANPWYFWLLPLFYTFSKLNIYGFSTLCLRFLHLVINQPETRKALKIQHGDVSKWS